MAFCMDAIYSFGAVGVEVCESGKASDVIM